MSGALGLSADEWEALERALTDGRWDQAVEFLTPRVVAAYGLPEAGCGGPGRARDGYQQRRGGLAFDQQPDRDGDEHQDAAQQTGEHSRNPS